MFIKSIFQILSKVNFIIFVLILFPFFNFSYAESSDNPSLNEEKNGAELQRKAGSTDPVKFEKNLHPISKRVFQAKALRDSVEWQQFVSKKELADLNYDLYRILGPNANDHIIMAQDPKGYLVNKHNKMFCFDRIDKGCQIPSPLYAYGDMRAAILTKNFYTNPEEINVATEVIRNIVNPFPSNIALEMRDAIAQEKDRPEKKAILAEAYASQARLGVARNSFNSILLDRLPLELLKGKASTDQPDSSVLGIMEQEAKDRFENPEWHKFIQTANQQDCLRELLQVEALMAWMLYNGYKQNERKEALLATIVAQQEELKQLISKHDRKN